MTRANTIQQLRRVIPLLALVVWVNAGCTDEQEENSTARLRSTHPASTPATEKAIFVIEPAESESQDAVRDVITQQITQRLAADPRIVRLVVNLPYDEADTHPVVPSAIEVYGQSDALRELTGELENHLESEPGTVQEGKMRLHAYLVSERLPRRHEQVWPDGTPTPGVRFMALMIRNPEMTRAEFDAYWRDVHTPIALAHSVQVLNYSQNTVLEKLTERSAPIDAIVGEQFASPSYSRDRMLKHPVQFARGVASGRRFIDLGKTRGGLMTETVVKSGPGALWAPR